MADFADHVVIFSILFLCFPFLSRCSRLRQSLFLLMHTTQISKAVLSTMMLISRRRQSGLRHRRMNRPRDQRWFGEIHRNPAMHGFFREHFRMSFDSFQALCRILSPFMAKRNTRFRSGVEEWVFLRWLETLIIPHTCFHCTSLRLNLSWSLWNPAKKIYVEGPQPRYKSTADVLTSFYSIE